MPWERNKSPSTWAPALTWEIQIAFLVPGFGLAQSSQSVCDHLGSKQRMEASLSLRLYHSLLPSVTLNFKSNQMNLFKNSQDLKLNALKLKSQICFSELYKAQICKIKIIKSL